MQRAVLFVVVLLSVSCRTAAPVGTPAQVEYTLKVAIYPVVNADTIAARAKAEFEQAYPRYQVTVTVANAAEVYDVDKLAAWLKDGTYDLVEADMILLEAVREKLRQSGTDLPVWTAPPYLNDWLPAVRNASTMNLQIYGVPHYGCGYFLFSTDPRFARITTSRDFVNALWAITPKKKYLLAMNVDGSVTMGAVYLNSWSAEYGNLNGAMTSPYDNPPVIGTMKNIAIACVPNQSGTVSSCVDGSFRNNVDRDTYVAGNANTFIGFSESLRPIRIGAPGTQFYVSAAPLGNGNPALMYADSLLRRTGCTADPCTSATHAFAEYYLRPSTYQWLLLGQDIPGNTVPRYLIPATATAWPRGDAYYTAIQTATRGQMAFPNATFYGIRSDMRDQIKPQIQP